MRSLDMKYSVLMPVYRKENPFYFYRAALSMMKQSVSPDEFVLVCDGPLTEELDAVIRKLEETWSEQVKIVRLPENRGIGPALAAGVGETEIIIIFEISDKKQSMLYLTRYLTKAHRADYKDELPDGMSALMIPNAEIKEIFETIVIKWFDNSTRKCDRNALFDAVWNGDSEGITREMNALLRRTISYHDYREDFYHAFLAGIFTGAGYMVDSNKEHGEGRSDVVVYDSINARVAVFEAKYTKNLEKLESECDTALWQIDDRMYAKEYEDDYDQVLCYGISFFKKRCMVKKK